MEANNKDIRNFLETHSRKTSREDQLKDVMQRLHERSDPKILSLIRNQSKLMRCKACGSPTHTIRSHNRIQEAASSGAYNTAVMNIIIVEEIVY